MTRSDCGRARSIPRALGNTLAGTLLAVLVLAVSASASAGRPGGIVRIAMKAGDVDTLDPALTYDAASATLVDPTCALLLRSQGGPHEGSSLQPEVASAFPRVSRDGRTLTFTLRSGFRFSDGTPVLASAFVRAINRILAPEMKSEWAKYLRDIEGADEVLAGKAEEAAGAVARGRTLIIRLRRPVAEFAYRATFLCAVPPTLPRYSAPSAVFVPSPCHGVFTGLAEPSPGEAPVAHLRCCCWPQPPAPSGTPDDHGRLSVRTP